MTHFFYPRHFAWLAAFSVLAALTSRLLPAGGISLSFAIYGGLHALALVLALRVRQPLPRMALFTFVAAALSVAALQTGLGALKLFEVLPGNSGLYAALGVAAMLGAMTYGVSIHLFRMCELSASELAVISVGCVAAAYVAIVTFAHFAALGRWWLAVLWWYAFSSGLWFCDRHPHSQSPS